MDLGAANASEGLGGMSTIVICVSLCFDESYEPSFISCIPILLMVKFPSLMVNDG